MRRLFTTLPLAVAYLTVLSIIRFPSVLSAPTSPQQAGSHGHNSEPYYNGEFSTLILDILFSAGRVVPSQALLLTQPAAMKVYLNIETQSVNRIIKTKSAIIKEPQANVPGRIMALLKQIDASCKPLQRGTVATFFRLRAKSDTGPAKPAARDALVELAKQVIDTVRNPSTDSDPPSVARPGTPGNEYTPDYIAAMGDFMYRAGRLSTLLQLTWINTEVKQMRVDDEMKMMADHFRDLEAVISKMPKSRMLPLLGEQVIRRIEEDYRLLPVEGTARSVVIDVQKKLGVMEKTISA